MTEKTGKIQNGRYRPGQSGNPSGRPPGSKNKTTLMALALLEGEAEALTRKIIELAKAGDMQALKACFDRLCPPLKAQAAPVQVEIPATDNLSSIARSFIKAAAEGLISPEVAAQMVAAVGTLAHVVETDELKARLIALETAVGKK